MPYKGGQTLEVLTEAKNYNEWIADAISKHLSSPVLEIGAGIGTITSLLQYLQPYTITDKDPHLVKKLRAKFNDKKTGDIFTLDIERASKKKLAHFKSIFAVNVLEHIDDDVAALKNMHNMLVPKGSITLLVPAHPFAYTKLDRQLGHFRRYSKQELRKKIASAGFDVQSIKSFNMVGLISWMVRDKVGKEHSALIASQVKMFDIIVPLLKTMERYLPIPAGISLIAVGKKKK